ncbi:hypothetical protein [Lamprocystis purpurea]|jgi:hypothetical protein|uniref:hypothetical protein n=1 Tax=Lamprocystis purpurea TaxID=61598 RepID=UPI00035FE57A|nr:hypothetical protein [Lamprocystis purpurea]
MIVAAHEAKGIGCPLRTISRRMTMDELTAVYQPGQLGNGTIPTVSTFAPCLHEQCMAWRWEDPGMDSRKMPDSYRADDGPRGYCGLAGSPLSLL